MNVAKINLEVKRCKDCPYVHKDGRLYYCTYHGLNNPGLSVEEGKEVPDWCPFVLLRLEKVLEKIQNDPVIKQGENALEGPIFEAEHEKRVYQYGRKFLEDCVGLGLLSNNSIQKLKLMLKIAVMFHNVGQLALDGSWFKRSILESPYTVTYSAELAKEFFEDKQVDIAGEDAKMIVHAISNHQTGDDTQNLLDAALLLGDKLDTVKDKVTNARGAIQASVLAELLKVEGVEFQLSGENKKVQEAKLIYRTSGEFDVSALSCCSECLSIPLFVAMDLKASEFKFIVDDQEIDALEILDNV